MKSKIIVNNVNKQKAINSIEYLKKLGYKTLSNCTYDDYLAHGNKHMCFVVVDENIFQCNCNVPYTKEDFTDAVYYEDIFKNQMDIE